MAKSLDMMTASEIAKAYDKASAACYANCTALINAGRGRETGRETRAMTDPLALEYIRVNDRHNAIVAEMEARKRYHGGTQRIIRKVW